jgi:hypothetical protein
LVVNVEKRAWQSVLDAEVQRWSAMPFLELVMRVRDVAVYEVEFREKKYQFEVELLRDTEKQLEIMIAADDGVLPRSLHPLTQIIAREKPLP